MTREPTQKTMSLMSYENTASQELKPKVSDYLGRLDNETAGHDWQRKMSWINRGDNAASNTLGELAKQS